MKQKDKVEYGSFEELQQVSGTMRKFLFDYIMGTITKDHLWRVYNEYEGHLLEHGYVESDDPYFKMDLPDYESFLNR
jgi:hypothetical protein